MNENVLGTAQARVLQCLARESGNELYEGEIVQNTGLSRSAVNIAARELHRLGLLKLTKKGRMNFYRAPPEFPLIQQFKLLDTLLTLTPLLEELKLIARRVVLFGSSARGDNTPESDLDLFVIAPNREAVSAILAKYDLPWQVKPIIVSPQEFAEFKGTEAAFYGQIQQGLTLWEANL